MAGRGCTILVKLLGGSNGTGETEDISLPVALHSPLLVLKEQLQTIVSIAAAAQVLILCDLSDPERNSDLLLTGRDHLSLHECGISNGSVLTLHALGMSAESKQKMMQEAFSSNLKQANADKNQGPQREVFTLETPITAAQANHSYNGVIFDILSNGPFEVDILSVSLAGMLGRVRIFARDKGWEDSAPTKSSNHWWAHQDSVSHEGWELVADINCRPSWDKPIEIKFNKAVRLLPHRRRGLYCHSSLPDDLGIQYQSYSKNSIVAQDEFVQILPGVGHTGSEPFEDVHGWYRSYRALSGSIKYHSVWKGWNPFEHKMFPQPLQTAVVVMLMAQNRRYPLAIATSSSASANSSESGSSTMEKNMLSRLPTQLIYYIMEFVHYDWYDGLTEEPSEDVLANQKVNQKKNATRRFLAAMFQHFGGNINIPQLLYHLGGTTGIEFDGEHITADDLLEYEEEHEDSFAEEDDDEVDFETVEDELSMEEEFGEDDDDEDEDDEDEVEDDEDFEDEEEAAMTYNIANQQLDGEGEASNDSVEDDDGQEEVSAQSDSHSDGFMSVEQGDSSDLEDSSL